MREVISSTMSSGVAIRRIRLVNFRAFEKLALSLKQTNVILGPNNAGKSTVLNAIRGAANMLRHAMSVSPVLIDQAEEQHRAYPIDRGQFDLPAENLKFELRPLETRIEVTFADGATLTATWPGRDDEEDDEGTAFFKLVGGTGVQPWRPADVRKMFPKMGVVPMLAPVEHDEPVLEEKRVRRNLSGRLASRHFRNQLLLLQREGDLPDFQDFCLEWLPDIRLGAPEVSGTAVDVFYTENRKQREVSWAGDGVQVYLQLLLHIYRLRNHKVLILDEPDVYLHPDLQRRLLRLLESLGAQVILSTHSSEIAAEASPLSPVWIDKSREKAIRVKDDVALVAATRATGTRFNLRLARALQARLVLFVEGQDMMLLASMARTVGARALATETGVAIVPLEGASNVRKLEGFAWVIDQLLHGSIAGFALLDRDYRTDEDIGDLIKALDQGNVESHVWARKELESYLLCPPAVSRLSGMPEPEVVQLLSEITEGFHGYVLSQIVAESQRHAKGTHISTIVQDCSSRLEARWKDPAVRLDLVPAKDTLSALNREFQSQKDCRPVSARALAREIRADELASEMRDVLLHIEGRLHENG